MIPLGGLYVCSNGARGYACFNVRIFHGIILVVGTLGICAVCIGIFLPVVIMCMANMA